MSRLEDHLLVEKVSKKEINDALNNTNVYIGAEFEFYFQEFEEAYSGRQEEYDDYISRYDDYEVQMDEYREQSEEYDIQMDDYNIQMDDYNDEIKRNRKQSKLFDIDKDYIPEEPAPEPEPPFEPEPPQGPDWLDPYVQSRDDIVVDESELVEFFWDSIPKDIKNIIKDWDITHDESLNIERGGIELSSEPMPLDEFLKITPKIFDFIKDVGYTDNRCGFHISISLDNMRNLNKELDVIKLALFTDEEYIYKFFDSRKGNTYAISVHDAVMAGNVDKNTIKKLIDEKKLSTLYGTSHFMAINIEHLYTTNEYIEFRYLGGKNYEKKWDKIKIIISHYIHNMSLACDPEYKKKEYIKKIQRILNKIELYKMEQKIGHYGEELHKQQYSEKEYKQFRKDYEILKKRVKLTKKERDIFSRGMIA